MINSRISAGLLGLYIVLAFSTPLNVLAQTAANDAVIDAGPDKDITGVENELEKNSSDVIAPVVTAPLKAVSTVDYKSVEKSKQSDDTVVIQKNYMPKTERFQAFGGLTFAPNDVFFTTLGLQARIAYHFSETWGVEFMGLWLNSSKAKQTKDLEEAPISVETKAVVSPRSYLGLDAYFNSMYGKAALYNRKIIPFEIYQTVGFGKMNTATANGADAFHLGIGQIFSISRSEAVRVDLSLIVYQSKDINNATQATNTLLLTVGYGRFFPEATYR